MTSSSFLIRSSSESLAGGPSPSRFGRPRSSPLPICKALKAAVDGLSKFMVTLDDGWFIMVAALAGDFFTAWGEDRGPYGEKLARGVAAAPCWD